MDVSSLVFKIAADVGDFSVAMDYASKSMDSFKKTVEVNSKAVGIKLGDLTKPLALLKSALAGLGLTVGFGSLVKEAGRAEKAINSLKVATGEYSAVASEIVNILSETTRMSRVELTEALATTTAQLQSMGFMQADSVKLSQSLIQLSADMSAFSSTTKDSKAIVADFTQAMLGNYRAVKQYGISLSTGQVEAYAAALGKQFDTLSNTEKELIRYQLIMSETAIYMGQAEKTTDLYVEMQKELKSEWADLVELLGQSVLPLAKDFVETLTTIVSGLDDFVKNNPALVELAKDIAAITLAFKGLNLILPVITSAIGGVSKALMALSANPVGAILSLVATVATVALNMRNAKRDSEDLSDSFDAMGSSAGIASTSITELQASIANLNQAQAELKFTELADYYQKVKDTRVEAEAIADNANKFFNKLGRGIADVFTGGKKTAEVVQEINDLWAAIGVTDAKGLEENLLSAFSNLYTRLGISVDEYKTMLTDSGKFTEDEVSRIVANIKEISAQVDDVKLTDWSNKMKQLDKTSNTYQEKRLKAQGKYNEALQIELKYLDEERKTYIDTINGAILAFETSLTTTADFGALNAAIKQSIEEAKGDLDITEFIANNAKIIGDLEYTRLLRIIGYYRNQYEAEEYYAAQGAQVTKEYADEETEYIAKKTKEKIEILKDYFDETTALTTEQTDEFMLAYGTALKDSSYDFTKIFGNYYGLEMKKALDDYLYNVENNLMDQKTAQIQFYNAVRAAAIGFYGDLDKFEKEEKDRLQSIYDLHKAINEESYYSDEFFTTVATGLQQVVDVFDDYRKQLADFGSEVAQSVSDKYKELPIDVRSTLGDIKKAFDDQDFTLAESLISGLDDQGYSELAAELREGLGSVFDDAKELTVKQGIAIGMALSDAIKQGLSSLSELFDQFADNTTTTLKNQLDALKSQRDEMKKLMDEANYEQKEGLTVAQRDALQRQKQMDKDELARLEDNIKSQEELIEEQNRKNFERQKAFKIAEAAITGAQSVVSAYNAGLSIPWIGAPATAAAFAAVAGAFVAAQIAAIASQPYPSYAVGAYNLPQDQMAQVHKGEMIIPRPFAEEIRSNGGIGGEVVVNVYGGNDDTVVETSETDQTKQIDIYITNKVKSMVMKGQLDSALQSRYVLSRTGRRG